MKLESGTSGETSVHMTDDFEGEIDQGAVVGSLTKQDWLRRGIDTEGVIGLDNGALRITPLVNAGWARAGVAYGPFRRTAGLAFSILMLNGHNTAQSENLTETFRQRFDRWLYGSETVRRRHRVIRWLLSNRKRRTLRQWRWWFRLRKDAPPVSDVNENLAVGWFPCEIPEDPLEQGNAFVMHATGPNNGELWARVGSSVLTTCSSVQNLPIYYVVVLRERGAAYYAASLPGANGLGAYPGLRPLAIDPFNQDESVYAAFYQATLGQIGFRLDTRVYAARVATLPELARWYGTAHGADLLEGAEALGRSEAQVGGTWQAICGEFVRGEYGASPMRERNIFIIDPDAPSGLIHVLINAGRGTNTAGLVWRARDSQNYWCLLVSSSGCELSCIENGCSAIVASEAAHRMANGITHSLQVLDDGDSFSLHLNGSTLFASSFDDSRLEGETGVGICATGSDTEMNFSRFEAHPRIYPLPDSLDLGAPWQHLGESIVVADDFSGPPQSLDARVTSYGSKIWHKSIGCGHFDITGKCSAKVRASANSPNPGRLAYLLDWDYSEFADIEVTITPPGSKRGQQEHGRGGIIFWQDSENYIVVNNWLADVYSGASVSSFFLIDGFEDLYDAIWSNVGGRIFWGLPHRFRVVFDGLHYLVFIDGEPVLYRSLIDVYPGCQRLMINRIGLISNWEWGNDTGSTFSDFCGRV